MDVTKLDIKDRADVFKLVSTFYDKIKTDDVLGPFFNTIITDWPAHLDHLTTFWESSLFLKTKYYGNPIEVHVNVDEKTDNRISEKHFGIWLNFWVQTVDELFEGEIANNAKQRARKMGTFLYLNIFQARQNKG
ncbi:group III truncated hemoglobin [uncultured Formosa sp.]|uniref:group III truncated hemoglobin n=1 Tax=uncultured Formosa sp. TaxID=255435 RepID=UPI0026274F29|nr:group III truncated hemoglobin [uncultured Formosa sp.]